MDNIKELSEQLVKNLQDIKTDYVKMKQERQFMIRKDIVAAQLKDILLDKDNLESNLKQYIDMLLKV